jgi:hypothetical protein
MDFASVPVSEGELVEEKRNDQRYQTQEPLTVLDQKTHQSLGTLVNLSDGGAMFVSDGPVRPGSSLCCRLSLSRPIMGHGEVVFRAECRWSRKNIARDRWEAGYRLNATGDDAYLLSFLVLSFKLVEGGEEPLPDVETADVPNRRRSVRFVFDSPLPVFDKRGYRRIGVLADVSVDGFLIITDAPVDKDEITAYRVQLPRKIFEQDYLTLSSQCRWCRKISDGTQFESGHSLQHIPKQDAAIILNLIMHDAKPRACDKKILVIG